MFCSAKSTVYIILYPVTNYEKAEGLRHGPYPTLVVHV